MGTTRWLHSFIHFESGRKGRSRSPSASTASVGGSFHPGTYFGAPLRRERTSPSGKIEGKHQSRFRPPYTRAQGAHCSGQNVSAFQAVVLLFVCARLCFEILVPGCSPRSATGNFFSNLCPATARGFQLHLDLARQGRSCPLRQSSTLLRPEVGPCQRHVLAGSLPPSLEAACQDEESKKDWTSRVGRWRKA